MVMGIQIPTIIALLTVKLLSVRFLISLPMP